MAIDKLSVNEYVMHETTEGFTSDTQAETNALLAGVQTWTPSSISANTNLEAKGRYFVTSASALSKAVSAW